MFARMGSGFIIYGDRIEVFSHSRYLLGFCLVLHVFLNGFLPFLICSILQHIELILYIIQMM